MLSVDGFVRNMKVGWNPGNTFDAVFFMRIEHFLHSGRQKHNCQMQGIGI